MKELLVPTLNRCIEDLGKIRIPGEPAIDECKLFVDEIQRIRRTLAAVANALPEYVDDAQTTAENDSTETQTNGEIKGSDSRSDDETQPSI